MRGDGPSKPDRIASIEALKEKEKGIMTISPQQEDIINKPEPKVLNSRSPPPEISIGAGHPGSHGCALNLKVIEGVEGEVVVGKGEVCSRTSYLDALPPPTLLHISSYPSLTLFQTNLRRKISKL